jgi:hypothetical protein
VVLEVPWRMSWEGEDVVVEPLSVPELLLAIVGVPLRPNIVVVPVVLVLVSVSSVMIDIKGEVVIAVGDVEDRVIVDE